MAGKPGRSGGARPGAGRKPDRKVELTVEGQEPLEFLLNLMRDNGVDVALRLKAAGLAAMYCHAKVGEGGKKDRGRKDAEKAGAGRFAAGAPPKLVINNK